MTSSEIFNRWYLEIQLDRIENEKTFAENMKAYTAAVDDFLSECLL